MQNRIHKYKAWHTDAKLMLYGTPKEVFQWVEDGQPVIPLQFSGLHDKNGKGIYEGDVVRLWLNDGWGSKDEYIGKIIFGNGQFMIDSLKGVRYKEPKCQYLPHNCMLLSQPELYEVITKQYISNYGEIYTFSENAMYVEIIGNLYENPELLK